MKRVPIKPGVGVITTSGEDSTKPYVDTLEAHDGRVILLKTEMDPELDELWGILLTGGGDLNESTYDHVISDAERCTLGKIELNREAYELKILQWAFEQDVPVLGICRGFQMMNVFAGGILIPDIPTWQESHSVSPCLAHRQKGDQTLATHDIALESGSRLQTLLGKVENIGVNTSHHQALSKVGKGFQVSGRAPDGIIEGIEHPGKSFWVGVQFHPERLWKRYSVFSDLFRGFIAAAMRYSMR